MRILIVYDGTIPVNYYGGTQRVIWSLGKELIKLRHKVVYLVNKESYCEFADVIHIDKSKLIVDQIPQNFDVIHFNLRPDQIDHIERVNIPYIISTQGNINASTKLDKNIVFVSKNHAGRYNSTSYVHNGLSWDDYTKPDLKRSRIYFHFIGNAAWRLKNVKGAIEIIKKTKSQKLKVLGGKRFNFKMGLRFTFSPKISFVPKTGGKEKDNYLNNSKGLIFPVRWNEPFGLAITESLYYGCPVFGTPYGSLSELVTKDVGFLSSNKDELLQAVLHSESYSSVKCHEYAREEFNSRKMALKYVETYDKVISGKNLNKDHPSLIKIQTQKFLDWN